MFEFSRSNHSFIGSVLVSGHLKILHLFLRRRVANPHFFLFCTFGPTSSLKTGERLPSSDKVFATPGDYLLAMWIKRLFGYCPPKADAGS